MINFVTTRLDMSNYNHLKLSIVSPVFFSHKNTPALDLLIQKYSQLPLALRKQIEFVFIDDCSSHPISINTKALNFQLYRIKTDIPWNQGGARNLGVLKARCSKLLLTDIDHYFPQELLKKMIERKRVDRLYNFKIKNDKGEKWTGSPNVFFTTKSVFYKALGYDEAFSGHYGYEDVYFLSLQKKLKTKKQYLTRRIRVVNNLSLVGEEDYHILQRDTKVNHALYTQKEELLKKGKGLESHSRICLNFEWEKVAQNSIA